MAKRTTSCRADTWFGLWLCNDSDLQAWTNAAWEIVEKGELKLYAERSQAIHDEEDEKVYTVKDGIGHMDISGPLTKYPTSFQSLFGGTSMMVAQKAIREMADNKDVKAIFINFDSPGGTVEGTSELASEIIRAKSKKPVYGHAPDKSCSGSLWLSSQCTRFTCGPASMVGSMGTRTMLWDTSEKEKSKGKKPIVISSGKFKALGVEGPPVSQEMISEAERFVQRVNIPFKTAVQTGRKIPDARMEEIATARVYVGQDAVDMGLCDAVCNTEQAYEECVKAAKGDAAPSLASNQPAAAHARSTAMALNQEQLSQARSLPGAAGITAENADTTLLSVATSLNTRVNEMQPRLRPLVDAEILKGRADNAMERLNILVEKGSITTAQKDLLASMFMANGQPIAEMLTPLASGKMPYESAFEALKINKPNGLQGELTGAQPAVRTEPGKQDDGNKPPTLERVNEVRQMYGLSPVNAQGQATQGATWNPVPHEFWNGKEGRNPNN